MTEQTKGTKWTTEPWVDAGTGVVVMNGESMEPILMAQIVDHENYDATVACMNVARAVTCVNAMQGIANPEAVRDVIEAARETVWARMGGTAKDRDTAQIRLKKALAALEQEQGK